MDENKRLCPNCRTELDEGARFCIECGSRIDYTFTREALQSDEKEEKGLSISNNKGELVNPFLTSVNDIQKKIVEQEIKPYEHKKRRIVFEELYNVAEPEPEEEIVAEEETAVEEEIPEPEEKVTVEEEVLEQEEEVTVEEEIPEIEESIEEEVIEEPEVIEELEVIEKPEVIEVVEEPAPVEIAEPEEEIVVEKEVTVEKEPVRQANRLITRPVGGWHRK